MRNRKYTTLAHPKGLHCLQALPHTTALTSEDASCLSTTQQRELQGQKHPQHVWATFKRPRDEAVAFFYKHRGMVRGAWLVKEGFSPLTTVREVLLHINRS